MAIHDFDRARAVHGALLGLFIKEPGGASNARALERIETLCVAAIDAVNDVEARVAIRAARSFAMLLYSDDGHAGIESGGGSLRGPEALRFQIMNALSAFRGRLSELETRKPSRPEIPAIAPKHLRVLVVEDNRDSAQTLKTLLEICGYAVTVAGTAMEGLEAAKRVRPDVVLCDIGLPDTDGFTLAEALHANPSTASARLIAVTAYGRDEDKVRAKSAGFELHLVKPVYPGTILQLLEGTHKKDAE